MGGSGGLVWVRKLIQNYSDKEKKLIISFAEMSSNKKLDREQINSLVDKAEQYEKNSNLSLPGINGEIIKNINDYIND